MWTATSVQLESPVPAAVCPGLTDTCAARQSCLRPVNSLSCFCSDAAGWKAGESRGGRWASLADNNHQAVSFASPAHKSTEGREFHFIKVSGKLDIRVWHSGRLGESFGQWIEIY